ncbi:luc7-like protein 3 [Daktulosphaira vitifoliae]|uniref:luc7-like protein 3 n=1 Tax=Daktulosphaira vitifoliae TaxID=58002 RepID=UPI0021AAF167|nr:luc7-like protein 3 [Daktulosphaira vitifoliae]XP_050519975.1 luc7-like protein 3 [Daktulosphaira vitifoliae]XP_050519976.1 luc7-like protein 3 [Daktulosphaira vitifoliae]
MAVSAAAALLDELMGRNRNDGPNAQKKPVHWEDSEFCKYFMVKFCPHDLFVNTRADLGACPKVHCEEAKNQYAEASSRSKMQYEDEFVGFATSLLNDVERRIEKGKQRLELMNKTETPVTHSNTQSQKNQDQIKLLSEKINGLVQEAEQMGISGHVEEAQGLMKLCDQLKEERDTLRKQNESIHWSQTYELAAAQEKQMEVCEVCGAFLIVGDAQSRIDDHLMGKQHMGYARLKNAVNEIQEQRKKYVQEREKQREEERKKRLDRTRSTSKDKDRHSRDHERRSRTDRSSRDRSHHKSDRKSDRYDRERKRSRSRDLHYNSSHRHRGYNGSVRKERY